MNQKNVLTIITLLILSFSAKCNDTFFGDSTTYSKINKKISSEFIIKNIIKDTVHKSFFVQIISKNRMDDLSGDKLCYLLGLDSRLEIKWKKIIHPFKIYQISDSQVVYYKNKSVCIDNNGEKIWKNDARILYCSNENQFLLGEKSRNLFLINKKNGFTKAKKNLGNEELTFIKDVKILKDSTYLIIGDFLIFYDLTKKRIYDYNINYVKKNYNTLNSLNILTIGLGLATGMLIYSEFENKNSEYYFSNLVSDSNTIFATGYNKIIAIDINNLKPKWEFKYQKKNYNLNQLIIFNQYLIQFNSGIGKVDDLYFKSIEPNITLLNKNTGEIIHKKDIQHYDFFDKFILGNDILSIKTNNNIYKIILNDKKINIETYKLFE